MKLDVEASKILVKVEHPRGTKFCCPECDKLLPCYDHEADRRWRHLDYCQFNMISTIAPSKPSPKVMNLYNRLVVSQVQSLEGHGVANICIFGNVPNRPVDPIHGKRKSLD